MLERDGILLDKHVNDSPGSQIALMRSEDYHVRISKVNFDKININEIINKFDSRQLQPSDEVYFCKTSITPRFKIKDYCENNKIELNKTNRIYLADTFVINKMDLEKVRRFSFIDYTIIPFDVYANVLYMNIRNKQKLDLTKYKNYYVPFKSKTHERRLGTLEFSKFGSERVHFIDPNLLNLMEILDIYQSNPSKYNIVFDQTISSKINEYVLDPVAFRSVEDMLVSNDNESWKLAAEILSNCDREKYKFQLLLLLNKYYDKISSMKQENLNVRLCLEYFRDYRLDDNWRRFLQTTLMKERGKIDDEMREAVNVYALNMVKEVFKDITELRIESVTTTIN